MPEFPYITRALTYAAGFRASGARGGLKTEGPDVALIVADEPCPVAAVFTTNLFQAAPVLVSREHAAGGYARAVALNAGCANAVTGDAGLEDAREMARMAAGLVGCEAREVLVASTGVIGHRLPMDRLLAGMRAAVGSLSDTDDADAALAIMTTDTRPKTVTKTIALPGGKVKIGGVCKGSGMIAPNMATMLGVVTTDAVIDPATLQSALSSAVRHTFNEVTVDGDTSTNDSVFVMASGKATNDPIRQDTPAYVQFLAALTEVFDSLARQIAWDGEGATKLVIVRVKGAKAAEDARRIARVVAESPLTKTALFGNDPNWGRILAAAGRSGVTFDPAHVALKIGDTLLVKDGAPVYFDASLASGEIAQDEVEIHLHLNAGEAEAAVYTCDFSYEYIRINAEYHT